MAATMERQECQSLIRLEGECSVTSAAGLKDCLLEALAAGKIVHLDLEQAGELDIASLQLLWAAGQEAAGSGATITMRLSDAAGAAARVAGFDRFPGLTEL
jgi:ABC-type transporter Mla MlaB component